jgi:alpha-tubulin suppressor-like RCC1 family protein
VKAGQYNSLALDTKGNIWGWGQKFATSATSLPTQVTDVEQGDATFVRIAAGYGHALAVDQEGKLYSWGSNYAGELGHGDTTARITPTKITVAGQPIFMRLAAGDGFSVALDEDGLLWTWGNDEYNMGTPGKLGRGTAGSSSVPTAITSPTITF